MNNLKSIKVSLNPNHYDQVDVELDYSNGECFWFNLEGGRFVIEHVARICTERALDQELRKLPVVF